MQRRRIGCWIQLVVQNTDDTLLPIRRNKLYGNSSLMSVKSLGKDNPNTKNTNIHNKNEQIKEYNNDNEEESYQELRQQILAFIEVSSVCK